MPLLGGFTIRALTGAITPPHWPRLTETQLGRERLPHTVQAWSSIRSCSQGPPKSSVTPGP